MTGVRLLGLSSIRGSLAAKAWSATDLGFAVAAVLACIVSVAAVPGVPGLLGAVLAVLAAGIARMDAREFVIPNALVAAALALGLVNAVLTSPDGIVEGVLPAIARGVAFSLVFFALQVGYRWLRGREGLGFGDVKLALAGGVWLDVTTMPAVVEIAAAAALAFYLLGHLAGKRGEPMRLTSRLPFGLFLAPAIWLGWLLQNASAPAVMSH